MRVTAGSSQKKYTLYAFDVESHNDEESLRMRKTSIWLACLIDENSTLNDPDIFMYDMPSVVDRIGHLSENRKGQHNKDNKTPDANNILIYVYNLAFEYSFLCPVLYDLGWIWYDGPDEDAPDHSFSAVTGKTCRSVWSIKLHYDKDHGEVLFRDLAALYHGSLRSIAESFHLETQKGEIDYTLNRLHDYAVTDEEKEYCFNDTKIVIEVLQKVYDSDDKIFFKSLSASSYAVQHMIASTGEKHPYRYFRSVYPKLVGEEAEFIHRTVAGGITYCTPGFQFKLIDHTVCHIDANQMHPSSAYLNDFPYGRGEYGSGKPNFRKNYIQACHIRFSYDAVKLHSIIKLINHPSADEVELYVWSFEIPTMVKCYVNARIEYIDYYEYKSKPLYWRDFYATNWSKRMKAIEDGDAFGKYQYKLLNNSSYGKLIENPHLVSYENIINENGLLDSKVIDNEISPDDTKYYSANYTYAPVGSCIPAYSRVNLIETALIIGWKNICYFDTDSIFFIKTDETMKRMSDAVNLEPKLGGWKVEETENRSQFTAPKRYKLETIDGDIVVKAAGFNFDSESDIEFESIDLISSTWYVHRAYRVKGGTIIDYQKKEIKVDEKYLSIYSNNI